jgi:hypothetical protein
VGAVSTPGVSVTCWNDSMWTPPVAAAEPTAHRAAREECRDCRTDSDERPEERKKAGV